MNAEEDRSHHSVEHEQRLASLITTTSRNEVALQNIHTATRELSLPLREMRQAFSPINQQAHDMATTVRALPDEFRDSHQKVLQELSHLASRVDNYPKSLERAIIMRLSAESNQLRQELRSAYSQDTNEIVAELTAQVGVIL